jgi:DNA invertase Pin-like site-specific DNA recombinase
MMKKVIELIRVSTQGQAGDNRASIPAQREINRRTAAAHNLQIAQSVEMVDVSGAAVLCAPEMQQLLKTIQNPEIHGVVAREFSRLMRPDNFADYAILQAFADTRTKLYLPEGPLDFNSKTDKLMGTIRAAMAGMERTEILERTWAAKESKRKAGKHPQNHNSLPFAVGYEAKNSRWFYKPEVEKVREAFRLFMSGETGYRAVASKVGIEAFNLRNILRNPVYTGWRVINQRRDPSSAAIRTRSDGRQADRPKIARSPEDVIRVKVLEPIISETEFAHLQQILDLKRQNHWRVRPDYERRFLYNGFLRCGNCGNLMYTHGRRGRSWYACKSRTAEARKHRREDGLGDCSNPYMRRERLEECIDTLISDRLTDGRFLKQLATAYTDRDLASGAKPELARIERELAQLKEKKQRVLDAFFENLIDRSERDVRLRSLEKDVSLYETLLTRPVSNVPALTAEELAGAFSVFHEWNFLGRADKRKLLSVAMPEIHVHDYKVVGLSFITELRGSGEINRTGRGSWRRRA